ncbi:hypothetical protein, partial [uncultured Spirosoma sp.]
MNHSIRLFLILLISWAITGVAWAQPIQATFKLNPPYSNLISDYVSRFNQLVTLQLQGNGSVRLTGYLQSNTGVYLEIPPNYSFYQTVAGTPITVNNLKRVTAADIQAAFASDPTQDRSTIALKRDLFGQYILPEGDYDVCLTFYNANGPEKLSNEVCDHFSLRNIEAPFLQQPADKAVVAAPTPNYLPVQFSWTFPAGAMPNRLEYVVQVAELRSGQNAYNVFETGPPFAEVVVPNASPLYVWKATDPRFEIGHQYAWRVQVRAKAQYEGLVNFQNNGYSTVNTFTYGESSNLVTSSEKVVGSKPKADSSAVAFTPITGSCSCKIDVSKNTSLNTNLTNSQTVYIGNKDGYRLYISELNKSGDAYSGTGTVALGPDLKPVDRSSGLFMPVLVAFKDITVNTDGVMIAGQVQSKHRTDIGFGPQRADDPKLPQTPNMPVNDLKNWLVKAADDKSLSPLWDGLKTKISAEYESYKQQAVQQANQQLNGAGIATPFGYSSGVFTVAVDNLVFSPATAQFDAFTVLDSKDAGVTVPLGLMGACLPQANCQGSPVLYLLRDTDIPYTAQTLTLKGGTDPDKSTYLVYNATGSNELQIGAEITIPDARFVKTGNPVKALLTTKTKDGFDNWQAAVRIDGAFTFNSIGDDFTFALGEGALYDHDINQNAPAFGAMLQSLQTDLSANVPNAATKLDLLKEANWQGFFMPNLTITLPPVFQTIKKEPVTAVVKNMVLGTHLGLTGSLTAGDVIKYADGSLDGWYFSLDKIGITFFDGAFVTANADGKIGLPISGKDEKSGLVYKNILTKDESGEGLTYLFKVVPGKDIEVPIWAAKFTLSEASSIQVTIGKTADNPAGGAWAGADLSGTISINPDYLPNAVKSSGLPTFSLNLMAFEHLRIQSKGPTYIDWGTYKSEVYNDAGKALKSSPFAGAFASPQKSIMGLPISIDDYGPVMEGTKVGFKFTATMALSDIPAVPKASATLRILANIGLKDGRPNWTFDNIYLDSIAVAGTIGPVSVAGNVAFYRKDGTYGDGLYGKLKATFPLDIGVGAEARFGTRNDGKQDMSYWYVSAKATGLKVAVGPGVLITGFGGGAYHNMTAPPTPKADQLVSNAPLLYKPQDGINGFQASVYLSSADGAAPGAVGAILKADGTLTVQFDKDWGLDLVEIKANAHLICNVPGASDKPVQGMADGTGVISYKVPDKMFNLGVQVKASIEDMVKLEAWLAVHVGPDGYYIKIGEPNNRVKLILKAPGLDINLGEATAYFVMGTLDMPSTLPDPVGIDPGLLAQVGYHKPAIDFSSGLAFGSALEIGTAEDKKHRFLIFYLKLHAGIGFDVILGETKGTCTGATGGGRPGINGYYAMGQVYAGVEFSFGVGVDLWFASGDFDVATVRAGAIFMGGLPNPTWLRGILYGQYDILDGLVSGSMSFKLKIGDVCMPEKDTNPFKLPLIADVSPNNGARNVSILKNPVVSFNYPVNQDICVSRPINENGDLVTDCYKIEFSLTTKCGEQVSNGGANTCTDCNEETIPNEQIFFSQRGTEATFYKEKAFSPDRKYSFTVKATAYRKLYNEATYSHFRDTIVTVSFTSGECIKTLSRTGPEKTITASYPFKDQRFLLQKEYGGRGFIQLMQDFSCCLRGNGSLVKTVAEFSDAFEGNVLAESPVTFDDKLLRFDIPTLPHEKVLLLRIVQKPTELAIQQANTTNVQSGFQSGVKVANNYVGITTSGLQFADGKNRDGAGPTAGTGTVLANAASSYRVVRNAGSQRLTTVPKPLVLTAYYFRTSRYDTWAAKLADRKQAQVEGELVRNPRLAKEEGAMISFDLVEGFDVFDIGRSTERLDVNKPSANGQMKVEIGYPALLTMQEPGKTVSYEGVSFRITNNSWFNTYALPIYKQAIHFQNAVKRLYGGFIMDGD